jgi:hypothetical protein
VAIEVAGTCKYLSASVRGGENGAIEEVVEFLDGLEAICLFRRYSDTDQLDV